MAHLHFSHFCRDCYSLTVMWYFRNHSHGIYILSELAWINMKFQKQKRLMERGCFLFPWYHFMHPVMVPHHYWETKIPGVTDMQNRYPYSTLESEIDELVDKRKKDLVSGKLRNDPYSDETIETTYNASNIDLRQGSWNGERRTLPLQVEKICIRAVGNKPPCIPPLI